MSFASNIGCNAASLKEFAFSECLPSGILEMSKLHTEEWGLATARLLFEFVTNFLWNFH